MLEIPRAEIERALHELRDRVEPELGQAVTRIVWANVDHGRVYKFLSNGDAVDVDDYVDRVLNYYRLHHEHVRRIQESADPGLWDALFQKLQKLAYGILSKHSFMAPRERFEHALQCATDASLVIADRRFPFDTNFEAWTYVVLLYTCKNHMRAERRERSAPYGEVVSLDAHDGWMQNLVDPTGEQMRRSFEQQHDLLQQVEKLGDAQREFVQLYYFEQKSYGEVAEIMGKKANALYKLNFDALDNLRKNFLIGEHRYG